MLLAVTTTISAQTAAKKPAVKTATTQKTATTSTKKTTEPASTSYKDERDGQVYKTAIIDGKTWMVEPFSYKPEKCDCIYWEEQDTSKGGFYTAVQAQKVIPTGWRIPTIEEYEALLAKAGKTPEELKKAGFSIELLSFNLDMYQTIKKYKNDAYMTKVLVGDKKAFNYSEFTEFLALKITKNKLADGTEYDSIDEYTFRVYKESGSMVPGPARGYLRMFLIKA